MNQVKAPCHNFDNNYLIEVRAIGIYRSKRKKFHPRRRSILEEWSIPEEFVLEEWNSGDLKLMKISKVFSVASWLLNNLPYPLKKLPRCLKKCPYPVG
ncbi:hypothetical protein AVEN_208899-1 [Araneus ventricosus]|uniref:Uncharacterized protein n=1 Tax=Araneus ventricosus TaxID=182803 RepID=A0A4Y2F2J4_ARAVE|nr:hypothetical protein AVEN_208899-1 [Araneus ventricosus]